MCWVQRA